MSKKSIIILFAFFFSVCLFAQQKDEKAPEPKKEETNKDWGIKFSGFVRSDFFWDSRKSVQVRDFNLNLYPADQSLDTNGEDVNQSSFSNYIAITSRLSAKITGPDAFGAKTSAVLEGDFFGNFENSAGLFRLRHAYINLDWTKTNLQIGQTWYPTFITECFPGVAEFNTGIPINPFGWATQIRLNQKFSDHFKGSLIAYKEREFTLSSTGTQNNEISIQSAMPTFHGQLQYKNDKFLLGAGAEYKSVKPRLVSNNYKSDETVNSFTFFGYGKLITKPITAKAYYINGANMTQHVMLGGYLEYPQTGKPNTYQATKTSAYWLDIASNNPKVAPGLFFGYTKQDGTDAGASAAFGRGLSSTLNGRMVKDVMKISGRVDFKSGKLRISPEIEYSAANYGTSDNSANVVSGTENYYQNWRVLASVVYSF